MKKKPSFIRWMLNGMKQIPYDIYSMVKNPIGEVALGVGLLFILVVVLPVLFEDGKIFLIGIIGAAFLLGLHGLYREDVS